MNFDRKVGLTVRNARLSVLAGVALLAGVLMASPAPASAAGLDVSVITWDILGVKSNNTGLSTGPGPGFPVGVKVCNSSGGTLTNVATNFAFTTSNSDITLATASTDAVASSIANLECQSSYFAVDVNRVAGARGTNKSYQITASSTEGSSGTSGTRTLYVQRLISQNRNTTHKIAGAGGCNADYTICDPAPTNLVVGNTYTYKLYAETATGYDQVESFLAVPGMIFRTESVEAQYQTPAGATATTPYADACGWTMNGALADFGSCTGPVVAPWAPGGKAGNKMVLTYRLKVISAGSGSMNSLIYDFSGGSFHYNSDFDDSSLSLTFTASVKYPLDVTVTGTGQVSSAPSGITCGTINTSCSQDYSSSVSVTLTATEDGTNNFNPGPSVCPGTGWVYASGSGASETYTCTVTMSEAKSATAVFAGPNWYPLDVQTSGAGGVTANLPTINCSLTQTSCDYGYASGTVVTLTATPEPGSSLDPLTSICPGTGWTASGGGIYTCITTMDRARSATALFDAVLPTVYGLTAAVTAGSGTISSTPAGIDCDESTAVDCSESYNSGTAVTLTATAKPGYRFVSWGGACAAEISATCSLTMSGNQNVTAQFELIPRYPLDVTVTGGGKVTGTGIDCGAQCTESYDDGTLVTLTASPDPGKQFKGWGGSCASAGTNLTCVVTMSEARSVTAQFEDVPAGTFPLSISKTGDGTVTGPGIDCGSTCVGNYPPGEKLTLTAKPADGWKLDPASSSCPGDGWTAAGDGAYSCVVTMSEAREAKVVFARISSAFVVVSTSTYGSLLSTKVRVPGPGTVSQRATRLKRGERVTACRTASRHPRRSGTVKLTCRLTAATRAARLKDPVVVRLCTTYRPSGGAARTKCRRIVLPAIRPIFTG